VAQGRAILTGRAMSVPFARGLGGRQGARAVNSERADLGDRVSLLVGVAVGVALQAGDRGFEPHQPLVDCLQPRSEPHYDPSDSIVGPQRRRG